MAEDDTRHLTEILACVRAAETDGPLPHRAEALLGGLSGGKTVGVLQRLVDRMSGDAVYLEVGVFQGLTLLSVAATHPRVRCLGIDNFSILDPEGKNLGVVRDRIAALGACNAALINEDFEVALEGYEGRSVGVYFVDGAHDYRSQLMGLVLALPHLTDDAAIVIDDANYAFVRQATRDFLIGHPEYKMVFEGYSPAHPANMDPATRSRFENGWLNGVNILVRDPGDHLPVMLPPTEGDRTLHVNDWLVHRHGLAELAPQALALARAVATDDATAEAALRERIRHLYPKLSDRYADRNTYSAGLTEGRFNAVTRFSTA